MENIFAVVDSLTSDQHDTLESLGMKLGDGFEVSNIDMGAWSTSIQLKQFPGVYFNSVNFRFFEGEGEEQVMIDIYSDSRFNPYLPRKVRRQNEVKQFRGTLKNATQMGTMIYGNIYGHEDFMDGTEIHTSRVVGFASNDSGLVVETLNSWYNVEFMEGESFVFKNKA